MEQKLQSICAEFTDNKNIYKEAFPLEDKILFPVCAMMHIDKDIKADKNKLLECKNILKENTNAFSNFRNLTKLPMITQMALSSNPEEKIKTTLSLHKIFKKNFNDSCYLALGAMIITDIIEPNDYDKVIQKANNIYKFMKNIHPFLTSSEDIVYCLLLAVSDKNEDEIIKQTEECYNLLKNNFSSANAVQTLSHALTLYDGSSNEKCQKFMTLYNDLKASGYKYGKSLELSTLSLVGNINVENHEFIEKFGEVNIYLKSQKGYGLLGIDEKQRYMHTIMILLKYYGAEGDNTTNFANTTISILIAQQIAAMSAVAACTAANTNT